MRMNTRIRWLSVFCVLTLSISLGGCSVVKITDRTGIKFSSGKMFHIKQVLEHYDVNGNAVPQYLELWLTKDRGRCSELDADGKELIVTLDTGKKHIQYDAAALTARETGKSQLFIVNFSAMKKIFPNKQYSEEGIYAERESVFHLMDNGSDEQWIKIYLDKSTGYTLYCDSESFRLRTALFEEVPIDDTLFAEPDGLIFKGGNK